MTENNQEEKRMLKKITASILSILMVCCLVACNKNTDKEENAVKPTNEPKIDYTAKYEKPLAAVYEFIVNIEGKVGPEDGMLGVWDAALALGDKALDEIGYTFKDLNGDDVSELLIGAFGKTDDAFTNNEIYMIYTLENDEPKFLLEGRSRSMYSLKDDGKFFYMGSNGAAYSMFGIYNISKNNEIECEDYYFTYPDDNDPAKIEIYHNEKGIFYREESEKLDITLDEFWTLQEEAAKGTVKLSATPFAELDVDIIAKAMEVKPAPDAELLDGDWILSSVEVEGSELTAEEAGVSSGISISVTEDDTTATYFSKTEYTNDKFEAELDLALEPLYEGCSNDEWSVRFLTYNSTFGEADDFYATLIDENTLLLQHLYPFDGTQGVSYQTYVRK